MTSSISIFDLILCFHRNVTIYKIHLYFRNSSPCTWYNSDIVLWKKRQWILLWRLLQISSKKKKKEIITIQLCISQCPSNARVYRDRRHVVTIERLLHKLTVSAGTTYRQLRSNSTIDLSVFYYCRYAPVMACNDTGYGFGCVCYCLANTFMAISRSF